MSDDNLKITWNIQNYLQKNMNIPNFIRNRALLVGQSNSIPLLGRQIICIAKQLTNILSTCSLTAESNHMGANHDHDQ